MLDPAAPDGRRDEVAGETRKRIESGGQLKQADTWGTRKLAFEIRQRTEADYRFYRFEAGNDLLEQLDHTLKITDGVLRFRIFKVDSGAPVIDPPPPISLAATAAPRSGGRRRDDDRPPRGPEPEQAETPAPAAEAPAPAAEEAPAATEAPAEAAPAETAPETEAPPADQPAEGEPAEDRS